MTDVPPLDSAVDYEPEPILEDPDDAPPPPPVGGQTGGTASDGEPPPEAGDPSI